MKEDEIIEKIENNKEEIKAFGVERLSLFGSHANGEANEQSDLDFLVEFEEDRGLFDDFTGLKEYLENLFDREVDLVKPHLVRKELETSILGGNKVEAKI